MEKTVIIYSHPNKSGFCGEFLAQCITQLKELQCDHVIIDLYAIGYDPALKNEEHYTSGGYVVSEENKHFQKVITDAKNLIFIYPTWWQNMPAILKGFIDRVFTSRFAFKYVHNLPIGLLKGRRAIIFTSAGGPRIYTRFFTSDRAVKVLKKDVLTFCGIKTRSFPLGGARGSAELKKKKITRLVQKGLQFLT